MNRQKFTDKFMAAFFILAIIKIIGILAQLFHQSFWSVVGTLVIFAIVAFIIFVVLMQLEKKEKENNSSGKGRNGGGNFYLEASLFDKIRNKYEELAQKYISEKDYKRAAKVYMNLMKDYYRGAKTLEEGGLYNEAAVIYLKKLKNKSEAANCYEKAKQYKKAIDLYKELEQKEKVGDLYRKMNDAKNANIYYQMVVDDYVNNSQMVKGSLIYRNIFDVKKLDQQIQELYQKTPSEKKITYLEAMKHEFKKDPKLQSTTRNIAYEIIAEKVSTRSEIVNELKHFNPDDEVILKDISRYKTGRNRIFRN